MARIIGYIVPEWPGQTHSFFWREIGVLEEMGADIRLVSTRLPPPALISHAWREAAIARTIYLMPISPKLLVAAFWEIARAGPGAILKCLKAAFFADDLSVAGKAKFLAFLVPAAILRRRSRKERWHHIHVHSCANSANIALIARLLGGPPYSVTLHGPLGDYGLNQPQKWRNASGAIVITKRLLGEVTEALADALPPVVVTAPMGVDIDRTLRSGRYMPWIGTGPAVVFCCGRLNKVKGHDTLIRAIKMLRERGIDAVLNIAGQDEQGGLGYGIELHNLIEDLDLRDSVTLMGAVSEDHVFRELENAHVFVLASHAEPLGVAIMEAMAMEVPVVSTAAGGVSELIESGVDGLLVPPKDIEATANAIERILRNPEYAVRISKAGRPKIQSAFSSRASAQELLKIVEITEKI